MAESGATGSNVKDSECVSGSQTETLQEECQQHPPTLQLRLNQPKNEHKVKWTSDTVDNEFMGKKKSKCCCIYEKPKVFGESSSSDEDEEDDGCTPSCKGHKKKCYRKKPHDDHDHSHDNGGMDSGGPQGCDYET